MNLDDLQMPTTASQMAKLLSKHYGIKVPLDQLTENSAHALLNSVQTKLNQIRRSKLSHLSEQNHRYNALMLTEQMLTKKLDEIAQLGKAQRAMGQPGFWGQTGQGAMDAATSVSSALTGIPGAQVQSPVQQANIRDLASAVKNLISSFNMNSKNEFAKILTQADLTEAEFNKLLSKAQQKTITPIEKEQLTSVVNDIRWRMRDDEGLDDNIYQINKVLKKIVQQNKSVKESNMRYQQIKTRKKFFESAMSEAEVVLAAKDIADRFQDMVETLGKMVNEELPALVETIRDSMGAEQADAYSANAVEIINSTLETVRGSKDSLESAARTLAGEEQPAAEPTDQDMTTADQDAQELDQIPPTATGDEQEPLGRGKR